jgi:hypothetical protein
MRERGGRCLFKKEGCQKGRVVNIFEPTTQKKRKGAFKMASVVEWFASISTDKFATVPLPLPVFAVHALALAWVMRGSIDARPRHPLASLGLLLVGILAGGTVTSLCLGIVPGWLRFDQVVLGYSLAWLVFRFELPRRLFRPLVLPALALHQVYRASVLATIVTVAGKSLRGAVFGPVFLSVFVQHGCTWLMQLFARVADGELLPGVENDFGEPSPSLRVNFWASLFYLIASDASELFGGALLPPMVVNGVMIAACEADFLLHTVLGSTLNFCAPLEWPITFLLGLGAKTGKPKGM